MSKITKIPLEIRNFFSEKRRSAVMDSFMSTWTVVVLVE